MADFTYELDNELEKLLMKNGMEEKIRNIVRNVLKKARGRLSGDIAGRIGSDPRKAYKAVKHSIYKRILGGNLSILNKRKRGAATSYQPQGTLRAGQLGGNRRARSGATARRESYDGADRGFILRFLNSGTDERNIEFASHKEVKNPGSHGGHSKYEHQNTGRRGAIAPRNFFKSNAQKEMEQAMEELAQLINEEIEKA